MRFPFHLQQLNYCQITNRYITVIQIYWNTFCTACSCDSDLLFTIENRLLVMKTLSVPVSVPICSLLLAQQNHVKFQVLLVDNKLHQRLKFTCTQKLFHCFAHFCCTTVFMYDIGFYSCYCCCCWFGHQLSSMCVWCFIGKMKLTMITRMYHYCTLGVPVIVFVFFVFMIVVGRHILWWEHFTVKQLVLCVMVDWSEFSKRRYIRQFSIKKRTQEVCNFDETLLLTSSFDKIRKKWRKSFILVTIGIFQIESMIFHLVFHSKVPSFILFGLFFAFDPVFIWIWCR